MPLFSQVTMRPPTPTSPVLMGKLAPSTYSVSFRSSAGEKFPSYSNLIWNSFRYERAIRWKV